MTICLSVYLSICLSVYLSICLSVYLSISAPTKIGLVLEWAVAVLLIIIPKKIVIKPKKSLVLCSLTDDEQRGVFIVKVVTFLVTKRRHIHEKDNLIVRLYNLHQLNCQHVIRL